MGASIFWGSREVRRAEGETEKENHELHKKTGLNESDLEELRHIFMLQHPNGVMTRAEFVADNVVALGGCEGLWHRVFDFAAENSFDDGDGANVSPLPRRQYTHMTFAQVILAASFGKRNDATTFERLAKRVFEFLDLHDDGVVDLEELRTCIGWLYAIPETAALRQSSEVLAKFCSRVPALRNRTSGGRSEDISFDELRHLYPPLVDPNERAQLILKWMDHDKDGVLSESEFMEACRGDQSFVEAFAFVPR